MCIAKYHILKNKNDNSAKLSLYREYDGLTHNMPPTVACYHNKLSLSRLIVVRRRKGEVSIMAKTKTSKTGKPQKKIVPVKPYKKADGTPVKGHRRSTPN